MLATLRVDVDVDVDEEVVDVAFVFFSLFVILACCFAIQSSSFLAYPCLSLCHACASFDIHAFCSLSILTFPVCAFLPFPLHSYPLIANSNAYAPIET